MLFGNCIVALLAAALCSSSRRYPTQMNMTTNKNDHHDAVISVLGPEDLPRLLALSREVGWPHTERDWKAMLSTGTTFGHYYRNISRPQNKQKQQKQQLASCIHLTEFGAAFATLGMLIVSKSHQKQGLGSKLVHQLLLAHKNKINRHHYPEGQSSIGLITASQAQSFYPQFGFQPTGEHVLKMTTTPTAKEVVKQGKPQRHDNLDFASSPAFQVTPITTTTAKHDEIEKITSFDHRVSKLDRGHLLKQLLLTGAVDYCFVAHDTTTTTRTNDSNENDDDDSLLLAGYGMAKLQGDLLNIGPIVATNTEAALALCQRFLQVQQQQQQQRHDDGPIHIRMDVYESQTEYVQELVKSLGFQQQGDRQAVMMLNTSSLSSADGVGTSSSSTHELPGNRMVMFCPASQAWL